MTLTTEELCFALATLYPKAKAVQDAVKQLRSMEAHIKGLQYDLRQAVESDILNRSEALSRIGHRDARLKAADELAKEAKHVTETLTDLGSGYLGYYLDQKVKQYRDAGKGE